MTEHSLEEGDEDASSISDLDNTATELPLSQPIRRPEGGSPRSTDIEDSSQPAKVMQVALSKERGATPL